MISNMRKHATGLVAQIFLGVLMLSFAFWGIPNFLQNFGTSDSVARVGDTEIGIAAFRRAYDVQIKNLSQQLGRSITAEQARLAGVPSRVVTVLVSEASLDNRAGDFGLGISNAALRTQIVSDPAFSSPGGTFNADLFNQILSASNTNEALYVADRRRLELRQQIATAVAAGGALPAVYSKALQEYLGEERAIRYVVLPKSVVGDVGAPTDDQLKAFFALTKPQWRAPEYRAVTLLRLEPADIAKPGEVSDAEIKAVYDRNKERFVVQERRAVRQILFPNRADADAALAKLNSGTTFEQVAKEQKKNPEDINLGMVARTSIADPKVADAVFGLKANAHSDVIDGRFGPVIVHVGEIEPGKVTPIEEVRDRIRTEIAAARAAPDIVEFENRIEDARAGGASLKEAAEKAGLKVTTIAAVNRQGAGPDGKPVGLPGGSAVLASIFASDAGLEEPVQPFGDKGALWFQVDKVEPARDRTLDEVRERLVAAWKEKEAADRLTEKAEAAAKRVRGGEKLEIVAKEIGGAVVEAPRLTRTEKAEGALTQAVIAAAFSGKEGTVAVADGADGAKVVVKVEGVAPPQAKTDDPVARQTAARFELTIHEDVLALYAAQVEKTAGVSVDNAAIQQAIGTAGS